MQGISSNKEDLSGEVAHKTTALWHDLNIDNSEATGVYGHAQTSADDSLSRPSLCDGRLI